MRRRSSLPLRLLLLSAWLAAALLLLAPARALRFDNDRWLPEDHPQEIALDNLADEFDPGDVLTVALPAPQGFFTPETIARLRTLEAALEEALGDDLINLRSALSATHIIALDGETLNIETYGETLERGGFDGLADYRRRFQSGPYGGRLVSPDARLFALRLALDSREQAGKRARLVARVRQILAEQGFAYHLIGNAALKDRLNRDIRTQLGRLIALAGLVIAGFLFVILRPAAAAPILAAGLLTIGGALSVVVLLGHAMTAVGLALPVLAGVIAVADGLHIQNHYDQARPGEKPARRAFARAWRPCLVASITSAVGFGAFAVSDLIPLHHFGLDAFAAILLAYPLILVTMAAGLHVLRPAPRPRPRAAWWLDRCHRLATARPAAAALAAVVIAATLAAGLRAAHTETNFLSVFYAPHSTIRQDFDLADRRLGGSGGMDVLFRSDQAGHFKSAGGFAAVHGAAQAFARAPRVNYVEDYTVPVAQAHRAFTGGGGLPDDDATLAQELFFLELSRSEAKDDVLSPYADFDYTTARVHLRTPDLPSQQLRGLIEDVRARAQAAGPATFTGFGVFIESLGREVIATQIESFLITLALISALFVALFGWRMGLAGLLANLLPVAATAGLIAWTGTPFDFAAILIMGITLGLCVDDAIHFLHAYAQARRRAGTGESLARALQVTGRPIALTSLLFCAGLAVLLASDLVILVRFALFSIFGLTAAAVSTLIFLPAALALSAPASQD